MMARAYVVSGGNVANFECGINAEGLKSSASQTSK